MVRTNQLTVHALGVVMIFTWGSTYYLMGVLAGPIVADTGWPLEWVVGSLSVGLLVAGVASPSVGDAISRRVGPAVLAFGCVVSAIALSMIAIASNIVLFVAGWAILGIGMAASLYDAAFSTLAGLFGEKARPSITTLTLWGGFASTVCWPISAALVDAIGWRGTCLAYAAVLVSICLLLILFAVPEIAHPRPDAASGRHRHFVLSDQEEATFWLFAAMQVLAGLFVTIVSVHLISLLQARGVTLAEAVTLGALIGPAQVSARVLEMIGRGRHHPLWTLTAAVVLGAAGLLILAIGWPAIGIGLILYGAGNGIFSIARGALPLALFGPDRYASVMGKLARPGLVAQAVAPLLGATVIANLGYEALLYTLAAFSVINIVIVGVLWKLVRRD